MGQRLSPEEKLERKRLYYQDWRNRNREKVNKATADWRTRNPDKSRDVSNAWKRSNPAKHCAINAKRKAAILRRTVPWANLKLIEKFYEEAARLTHETGEQYHVDHVIPLQGRTCSGLHVHNNLQVITAVDNMRKGNR